MCEIYGYVFNIYLSSLGKDIYLKKISLLQGHSDRFFIFFTVLYRLGMVFYLKISEPIKGNGIRGPARVATEC